MYKAILFPKAIDNDIISLSENVSNDYVDVKLKFTRKSTIVGLSAEIRYKTITGFIL